MSAEITLFVNPTAGSGRAAHAAQPAASALRGAGFSVRTVVGGDAPDALARLRTAVREGTGAVIAVGGDGMMSLALQALAGTLVPLGWSRWAPGTISRARWDCPYPRRPCGSWRRAAGPAQKIATVVRGGG